MTETSAPALSEASGGVQAGPKHNIRVTCIYPGVVESELANTITDSVAAQAMESYRQIALKPEAIAAAIVHVIGQPDGMDTSDIVVRPTASA